MSGRAVLLAAGEGVAALAVGGVAGGMLFGDVLGLLLTGAQQPGLLLLVGYLVAVVIVAAWVGFADRARDREAFRAPAGRTWPLTVVVAAVAAGALAADALRRAAVAGIVALGFAAALLVTNSLAPATQWVATPVPLPTAVVTPAVVAVGAVVTAAMWAVASRRSREAAATPVAVSRVGA